MEENAQKRGLEEKISVDELLEQVKLALSDEFVAKVRINHAEKMLTLRFPNGQKFSVAVWEMQK